MLIAHHHQSISHPTDVRKSDMSLIRALSSLGLLDSVPISIALSLSGRQ